MLDNLKNTKKRDIKEIVCNILLFLQLMSVLVFLYINMYFTGTKYVYCKHFKHYKNLYLKK